MEAGVFLLLLVSFHIALTQDFYGQSISFMHPQNTDSNLCEVIFYQREYGRDNCQTQSDFICDPGVCTSFEKSSVVQTDQDETGQGRWCQSESYTTAIIPSSQKTFRMSASGCCWLSNINGKTDWTSEAELLLAIRSDTDAFNNCPVTTTVSYLRVPQNCFQMINLLAHDPEDDFVRCSFANSGFSSEFSLDPDTCNLTTTVQVSIGVHVFEIVLEDFPTQNITLTFADGTEETLYASDMTKPLCKVTLQFSLEILPTIPTCENGHIQPVFVSGSHLRGDVVYATVDQAFELVAQAQAHHASLHEFQVSGPGGITKTFTDDPEGKASVRLNWTPTQSDLFRIIPLCLSAETNESQSFMRCVVVVVVTETENQVEATVHCTANKIEVAIERASIPDVDINYLRLLDRTCSLTTNDTHIIGMMSFHTCGTEFEDQGDFLVFKNRVISVEPLGTIITRRKYIKINFFCRFLKKIRISSSYNLEESNFIFTHSSFGSFGYVFGIYLDNTFQTKVEPSAYPVEVNLLESIFLGIHVQSGLPNVRMFVESCRGTPDANADNIQFWDIIKNGCIKDETFKVSTSDETTYNFEIQAFKFTGNNDQVYITCTVILCDSNSDFTRCNLGCLSDPLRRRKRDLSLETFSHRIIQGPIRVLDQNNPSGPVAEDSKNIVVVKQSAPPSAVIPVSPRMTKGETKLIKGDWEVSPETTKGKPTLSERGRKIMEILQNNTSTMVSISCFLLSLLALAMVVRYFSKKKKAEEYQSLVHSG